MSIAHPSSLAGPKLLLVEDDRALRMACADLLRAAGYRVSEAADGLEALEVWERESPELVLLDVEMPRLNGWETLARLRQAGARQPIMMLTGLVEIDFRVRGLSAGADDYMTKPVDPRELIARVGALLRRCQRLAPAPTVLRFGAITVDLDYRRATTATGEPVPLTKTEFSLLEILARQSGRPVSRETILTTVWGYTHQAATRTVETHIWRLRGKLGDGGPEPKWIKTIPAAGYALAPEVTAAAVAA